MYPQEEDELTPPQVAELIGATRQTVSVAIRKGRLPARKLETPRGPLYLVRLQDAEAFGAQVNAWQRSHGWIKDDAHE